MEARRSSGTCYCGAVKITFPIDGPDVGVKFLCHCTDCRKFTGGLTGANFNVRDSSILHDKGEDKLLKYEAKDGIASGNTVTNFSCSTCACPIYRRSSGFPGWSILRLGLLDEPQLIENELKPDRELFAENKAEWLKPAKGLHQIEGQNFIPFK